MNKAIVVKKQDSSVDSFITQALASNANVETMEKLFALRERVKAEQAKEAFVKALSKFQSECPKIDKTKKVMNKDGTTVRYKFAPLDVIVEQIKKVVAQNGFSYTWDVKNEVGFITAVATITHELGHSQASEFKIPIDKEGYMTEPQKYASALTFAKRYSLINAFGISTGDEDTDATDVNKQKEAKSIKSKIILTLRTLGEKTNTKQEVEEAINRLTKLEATDGNFEEILGRLEILEAESHDD